MPIVLIWVVLFTAIRATVVDYILHPLARAGGVKTRKASVRFAEQAWLLVYCSIFWSLGMVCGLRSPGTTHFRLS